LIWGGGRCPRVFFWPYRIPYPAAAGFPTALRHFDAAFGFKSSWLLYTKTYEKLFSVKKNEIFPKNFLCIV
jgi:hypothetical protein